jgi:broad specificity phosphatase PhoE
MSLELPSGLTLYFARHGQTQANVEKRFSGYKDTPLTALGLAQARDVGLVLKRELGDAAGYGFVSSPLARAVTTMEIARQTMGLPGDGFSTDNRLKEIDLGIWDQLTDEEARAVVAARVSDWVRELKTDTVAVSHGATTRILRGLLAGLDWQAMSALDEPQGVVFRVQGGAVTRLDP